MPFLANCQKEIWIPAFLAKPMATTFSESTMIMAFLPKSAPKATAHHKTSPALAGTVLDNSKTTGDVMRSEECYPQFSTNCWHSHRLIAAKVTLDPTKSFKNTAKVFITSVLTKTPTMMNKLEKKVKVPHSIS